MNNPTHRKCPADRGSISLLLAITALAAAALIALQYDGGRADAARAEAIDIATSAARAGADQIDLTYLRTTGITRLDLDAAHTAAAEWIAAAGHTGTVEATTGDVTATVTIDHPTELLGLIGIHTITVDAEATARPRFGIDTPFGGAP